MTIKDESTDLDVLAYVNSVSPDESPILQELRQVIKKHPCGNMVITPLQSNFLKFLIRSINAQRVLELGTFMGYSSLVMAESLSQNGKLVTLDKNAEWAKVAKKYWEKAGVTSQIELILGNALDTLAELVDRKTLLFDFIFIDADKKNYLQYYEKCLPLLAKNGIMVVDNVLLGRKVLQKDNENPNAKIIREFNEKLKSDERINYMLLPIADGMTLITKK